MNVLRETAEQQRAIEALFVVLTGREEREQRVGGALRICPQRAQSFPEALSRPWASS